MCVPLTKNFYLRIIFGASCPSGAPPLALSQKWAIVTVTDIEECTSFTTYAAI